MNNTQIEEFMLQAERLINNKGDCIAGRCDECFLSSEYATSEDFKFDCTPEAALAEADRFLRLYRNGKYMCKSIW